MQEIGLSGFVRHVIDGFSYFVSSLIKNTLVKQLFHVVV